MTAPAQTLQPRAIGRLEISAHLTDRGTVLKRLHQKGAMRALFPHGSGLTAVALNTSGGVTGGDSFATEVTAHRDADMTITTQAAERLYRAQPGEVGKISNTLTLEAGARLVWLPQETIVFDGAAVTRRLRVDMAADATAILLEPMVFGRAAMGEEVRHAAIRDRIDVYRDGALVFADRLRLEGDVTDILSGPATGGGAAAQAALIIVSPDADRLVAPLRRLMPATGGVSLIRPGVCFARILARDGYGLRQTLLPALTKIGVHVPRPWTI